MDVVVAKLAASVADLVVFVAKITLNINVWKYKTFTTLATSSSLQYAQKLINVKLVLNYTSARNMILKTN